MCDWMRSNSRGKDKASKQAMRTWIRKHPDHGTVPADKVKMMTSLR